MWQLAIIPAALILLIGVILFVVFGPAFAAWLKDLSDLMSAATQKIRKQWRKNRG